MSKQAFRATAHGVCLLLWVDHLLPLAKPFVSLVDCLGKPVPTRRSWATMEGWCR